MRKVVLVVIVAILGLGGFVVYNRSDDAAGAQAGGPSAAGRAGGPGGGNTRPPMPVEFGVVTRAPLAERVLVVGNLIGALTVQAVPKINGRLQSVNVQLGDPVRRGQMIAKVEDREIQEQVRQAEAAFAVSGATIRQRDADLKLAQTNLDRNRSLLDRQLLPRQTYDDTDARYQAAVALLDLARAQHEQAKSRLEELKINLSNTVIASPVDGFVGKRFLDPGATVSPNVPVASVVDIRSVRMVANLVEKDVKRVTVGTHADVEVDAYPGETFTGRVSRMAPVFDPATRTAEMEIEVPNPGYRLKPGMYARVQLTVSVRPAALTVPSNAVVMLDGRHGVFVADGNDNAPTAGAKPQDVVKSAGGETIPAGAGAATPAGDAKSLTARFMPVETGIHDGDKIEIVTGLRDGLRVVTTGAGALKDGDKIVAAQPDPQPGKADAGERGARPGSSR
jgi:membrane fusion protein, multidrug efflux system